MDQDLEGTISLIIAQKGMLDYPSQSSNCYNCGQRCDNIKDANFANPKKYALNEDQIMIKVRFCTKTCVKSWNSKFPNRIPDRNIEEIKGFVTKRNEIYLFDFENVKD